MSHKRNLLFALQGYTVCDYIRFFTPTPKFFDTLKEWAGDATLFECGCGSGDTTKDLWDRGIPAIPLDMNPREGQPEQTMIFDATQLRFDASKVALICRPDHSGWASVVISNAVAAGSSAIYVGLKQNFERDLGELLDGDYVQVDSCGMEGESALLFSSKMTKEQRLLVQKTRKT